jgi:hypothetical protein
MATSSKPTASLYIAIAFAALSLLLGVFVYIFHRDFSTAQLAASAAKEESNRAQTELRNALNDIDAMKSLLGKTQPQVVDQANPDNAATVVGDLKRDLTEQGGDQRETTYAATLTKLRTALNAAQTDRDQSAAALATAQRELLSLQNRYQTMSTEHDNAKIKAEQDLRGVVDKRNEELASKDQQISTLKTQKAQVEADLQNEKDARTRSEKKLNDEVAGLKKINTRLREELEGLKAESFEVPDGTIRKVDNTARMVWIDLGDADFLKPRMTFSVYSKETPGVGRTTADIKGKIEVTRIVDPHLAEAKMIEEDIFRPMSPGDFIYTPLWSPGRPERFAVVGFLDLDGDAQGVSDQELMNIGSDRDLFLQEMAVRGADIVSQVDDTGERIPAVEDFRIDESVKYLIIGRIPDQTKLLDKDQAAAKQIQSHLTEMRSEAQLHGVKILTLSDFLSYVGYKPKRRLFEPGQERPYNLKAGAASAAINAPADRSSTGQVSGSYGSKSRGNLSKPSSGTTSKLFGSGQ